MKKVFKPYWEIAVVLILAAFLRIYKIGANYFFTGELGKELLYVRELALNHKFPLTGLATSHEWLTYGPVYYWILTPLSVIFKFNPFVLFWLSLVTSLAGIVIVYWVFGKIINKKFALITAFLVSISPIFIWQTRLSKLHTFFFILIPLVVYFLFRVWKKDLSKMFWLGISFGLLFSFHYSQIPIFGVIILAFFLKRNQFKIRDYLKFLIGLILPNITVFIYDAAQSFQMTKNLFLWLPYRILSFFGLYHKNDAIASVPGNTPGSFNEFFGKSILWDNRYWIWATLLLAVLLVVFVYQNRRKIFTDFFVFYLSFSTIFQCLALVIHTKPPLHYFMPIFINVPLLITYFINRYWHGKLIFWVLLLAFAINLNAFSKDILFYGDYKTFDPVLDFIPLAEQKTATSFIVSNSKGQAVNVKRVGPYDFFPENYAQNYKFLVLNMGGRIDPDSGVVYTITESGSGLSVTRK